LPLTILSGINASVKCPRTQQVPSPQHARPCWKSWMNVHRRKAMPEIQPANDEDEECAPALPSDWTCDRILQVGVAMVSEASGHRRATTVDAPYQRGVRTVCKMVVSIHVRYLRFTCFVSVLFVTVASVKQFIGE
jgi:hypothetical protein